MDIYLVKTLLGALKPIDGTGEEYIGTLGTGEVVRAQFKKDRNPGHHRKFFGVLNLVYQNQTKYLSQEGLRFAVMIAAGYAEEIRLVGDTVGFKPKSISWSRMDQHAFDKFYNAALQAIPRLLPEFEGIDLDRELLDSTT